MRGKTNIGGGGVPLNAYIESMIVGAGNIDSGDFVQYYTQPEYIEQSVRNYFLFNVGGYAVSKKGNGLALFKDGYQLDEFSTYSVDAVCTGNGFIFIYSANSLLVASLRIANDAFVLIDTINITNTGSYPVMAAGDGKICLVMNQSRKYIYGFSFSNTGELDNLAYLEKTSGDFYNYYSKALVYYDGYFYYLGAVSSSYTADVSSVKLTVADGSITSEYIGGVCRGYKINILYQNNNKIFLNGDSLANKVWNVLSSQGAEELTGLDVIVTVGDNYKFVTVADRSGGGSILKLYQIDANTNEVSLLFTKEVADERYRDEGTMGIVNGDYIYLKIYESPDPTEDLRVYKIVNGNEIQDVPQTGYVIPYSQAGKPIGVAKDSGMVGDTIDVYVPIQSV